MKQPLLKKKSIIIFLFLALVVAFKANQIQAFCSSCAQAVNNNAPTTTSQAAKNKIETVDSTISGRLESVKTTLTQKRAELQARKELILEKQATRQAENRERISERVREQVKALFGRTELRFLAAITRQEKIISRIESRLLKIETENPDLDLSPIQEELLINKIKLNEAKQALSEVSISLEAILDSEDPKSEFIHLKNLLEEIKSELIIIHQNLVHLIGEIRGLRVGNSETASSSAE